MRRASLAGIAAWLAVVLLLSSCATTEHNRLATWVPSENYNRRGPQMIVLHYTQEGPVQQSLDTLRGSNSGGPVSAHYLIGRHGRIFQLVADRYRAWHAGGGQWGTINDVNSASIGIEIANNGSEPFPPAQIDSLLVLLDDLVRRWHIPCTAIIGHQDMAPSRKPDPGPLFPWAQLAAYGYGLWSDPSLLQTAPPAGFDPWLALAAIGYPLDDRAASVRAFHNHFRGLGGETLDAEDIVILHALAERLKQGRTDQACGNLEKPTYRENEVRSP